MKQELGFASAGCDREGIKKSEKGGREFDPVLERSMRADRLRLRYQLKFGKNLSNRPLNDQL